MNPAETSRGKSETLSADLEASALLLSILDPRTDGSRAPLFDRLRDLAPVHRINHPLLDGWYVISGYDNIQRVLMNSKSTANGKVLELINARDTGVFSVMNRRWMKFQDRTADHDRIRKLFQPFFTPAALLSDRSAIRYEAERLLAQIGGDAVDLIENFAFPLPVRVVARKLGIAISDMHRFQKLMDDFMAFTGTVRELDASSLAARDEMTQNLLDFFAEYVAQRRKAPEDDLISKLAAKSSHADVSDEELLAQLVFLLIAGHSTTADMIGNSLVALAENPAQRRRITTGEVSIATAVDELIRYDTSLSVGMRHVNVEMDLPGGRVPADTSVMLAYPSAHRDPAIFAHPNTLDLCRKFEKQPLPFGAGRYFCLGSNLAKMEIEEALAAVLTRMPAYRILDVAWQGSLVAHGPRKLLVAPE